MISSTVENITTKGRNASVGWMTFLSNDFLHLVQSFSEDFSFHKVKFGGQVVLCTIGDITTNGTKAGSVGKKTFWTYNRLGKD